MGLFFRWLMQYIASTENPHSFIHKVPIYRFDFGFEMGKISFNPYGVLNPNVYCHYTTFIHDSQKSEAVAW